MRLRRSEAVRHQASAGAGRARRDAGRSRAREEGVLGGGHSVLGSMVPDRNEA